MNLKILHELTTCYTRRVRRVTKNDYYKAVKVSRGLVPHWACRHKHETRMDAFDCLLDTGYFGKCRTEEVREYVTKMKSSIEWEPYLKVAIG